MAIGGMLGWMKFPVSYERVAFSWIGGSSKAARILEEGNRRRERERESGMGWGRMH
jgi:hypothetical protein